MRKNTIIVLSLIVISIISVYIINQSALTPQQSAPRKELLVYCGITMIQPMSEIAAILEEQENIKISIIKGGSGNLLRSIKFNRLGDLYLPGSESYILQAKEEALIVESAHIGYNKAAIMVQEGNPKNIPAGVMALLDPELYIVIGNPDTGSIGKETKKILTAAGIFSDAMQNARELTTDSKRLIEVLKKGEADLVVNWYATATWPENAEHIDALQIEERFATKKKLILGLLKTSKYPKLAKKFMDYASSDKGRTIFERYGLYTVD
ncbi:MAG: substrate-binding domain-containing protein [Candidatus Thiodiazotropha sp.]